MGNGPFERTTRKWFQPLQGLAGRATLCSQRMGTEQRLAAESSSQVSRPPLHWLATAKSSRELHYYIRHCGRFVLALRRTWGRGVPRAGTAVGFGVALTFLYSIEPYLTFEHTPDHWKHGLLIVPKGFILALHLNEDMVPTDPCSTFLIGKQM